jgi:peptidyl-prolyl cis-trans isomerase C
VLARIGPLAIDAPELGAHAARLLPAQRAQLGPDWREQRRRLLQEVLVPQALLQVEAARVDRGLLSARDRALADALTLALESEALARGVAPAQLASRQAEQGQRDTQRTLLLWRILLRSEAEALALLKELGPPSESAWTRLARERSIDRATHMRSGSLGYVAASGQTHMPQVRVSPALFAAASQVEDGQLVPRPVPEAGEFAVVWRRASSAPPTPSSSPPPVDPASTELGALLVSEAVASEARALTQRLRAERLRGYRPELIEGLTPRSGAALEPAKPGGGAPVGGRPVTLAPRPTDSGLR